MFDKIIELVREFAGLFQVFAILRVYQGGIILRWGNLEREAKVGFNWLIPFGVEELLHVNIVTETMLVGPQSLTTKDGKQIVISTVVTFRVKDPTAFLLRIEGANRVIEDSAFGEVAEWVRERTWEELVESNLRLGLTHKLRRRARGYGVKVLRVQVVDLTTSRSLRLLQSVSTSYAQEKVF